MLLGQGEEEDSNELRVVLCHCVTRSQPLIFFFCRVLCVCIKYMVLVHAGLHEKLFQHLNNSNKQKKETKWKKRKWVGDVGDGKPTFKGVLTYQWKNIIYTGYNKCEDALYIPSNSIWRGKRTSHKHVPVECKGEPANLIKCVTFLHVPYCAHL